jgi:hypothetical protein
MSREVAAICAVKIRGKWPDEWESNRDLMRGGGLQIIGYIFLIRNSGAMIHLPGLGDFVMANVGFNVATELVVQYDCREFNCGEHASGSKYIA